MKKKPCVMPVAGGWFVVESVLDVNGTFMCLHYEPVIAWAITIEKFAGRFTHGVDPITVNMVDECDGWVFKKPDGTFTVQCEADFGTEAEVLKFLTAREKRKAEHH